jgi:hypothetical protein
MRVATIDAQYWAVCFDVEIRKFVSDGWLSIDERSSQIPAQHLIER